jgi:hypothetical protein
MKAPNLGQVEGAGVLVAAAVAGLALWAVYHYGKKAATGILTGDNALTRNAVDWNGNRETAYQGVPVLGTLGAGANAATGGALASVGDWLGSTFYDATHPYQNLTGAAPSAPPATPPSAPGATYDPSADLLIPMAGALG